MKCFHPIDVSVKSGSDVVPVSVSLDKGIKRRSAFNGRSSFLVPCGRCIACKARRKSEYVFRMDCERRLGHLDSEGNVKRFRHCFFITLTYAPEFLPHFVPVRYDTRTGELFDFVEVSQEHTGLLNPEHLVSFMKRLRTYYKLDCKAFLCGEYGDDYSRPHYHLIFYSDLNWQDCVNAVRRAWSMKCPSELRHKPGSFVVKDGKYCTWRRSFGRIEVKPVNMRRIRYCAKYVCKDTDTPHEIKKFGRASCRLGSAFLLSAECRAVRQNKRLFAYTQDGKRASLGRYFTHRIFRKDELRDCVDAFIEEFESPPEGSEFGEKYKRWYDVHLRQNNALYRQALANQLIPQLCYV